ncbi:MAG: hypothetical protein HYW63_02275 [Candidatus Levybacteria bacterium]|nr:hypothetical protein [Candidatus Levybacteria bacterium]
MKQFDKIGLIKHAWEIVKKNVRLIALLVGAFIVYQIIQGIVQGFFRESVLAVLVSLAFTVITLFLEIGAIKIFLKLVDGQKAEITELWAYPQYLLRMIGASILFGLIVLAGFILLIIPGIYLAIRLQFYSFYIVDKNEGVIDSLQKSWKVTQGNVINLFLFMLLLVALNILGALALLVGLLVTIPVSFIAVTLLYRKLAV